jgi:mutator protein MutT
MPRKRIAIGLIWNNRGEIVVGQRAEGDSFAGFDELPGGHCEENESPEEAVIRECLEETGLVVHVHKLRIVVEHTYERGELELSFFDCRLMDGPDAPLSPFKWWSVDEVLGGKFPPANERILESLRENPAPIV